VLIPFFSIALGYGFRDSETWDLPTLLQEFGVMSGGVSAVFATPSLSGLDKVSPPAPPPTVLDTPSLSSLDKVDSPYILCICFHIKCIIYMIHIIYIYIFIQLDGIAQFVMACATISLVAILETLIRY
jgi:hypothetical protein